LEDWVREEPAPMALALALALALEEAKEGVNMYGLSTPSPVLYCSMRYCASVEMP
jgi:hypothetical protein